MEGEMFLENLSNCRRSFGLFNCDGLLTDARGLPLYISAKGKAIASKRPDICLLSLFRRALGNIDSSQAGRAAEKGFQELAVIVLRLQGLGRPLNAVEREDLRGKKEVYEKVCLAARVVWGRQTVRPRTPAWMQYEICGTREAIDRLLAVPI